MWNSSLLCRLISMTMKYIHWAEIYNSQKIMKSYQCIQWYINLIFEYLYIAYVYISLYIYEHFSQLKPCKIHLKLNRLPNVFNFIYRLNLESGFFCSQEILLLHKHSQKHSFVLVTMFWFADVNNRFYWSEEKAAGFSALILFHRRLYYFHFPFWEMEFHSFCGL